MRLSKVEVCKILDIGRLISEFFTYPPITAPARLFVSASFPFKVCGTEAEHHMLRIDYLVVERASHCLPLSVYRIYILAFT